MNIVSLRRRSLSLVAAIGTVVLAMVSLFALDGPDLEAIEQADLAVLAGKVIAIDPGHGGIDGGAKYNGLEEKDITLAISLKLGEILKANGATVVFTRDTDRDFYTRGKGGKRNDLLKRVEIINNSGASLFVGIHANAISGSRWFGAEVYYSSRLAASKMLAEVTQRALQPFPPGNKRQIKQDSTILVLKETTVPGMLVEVGFLSNPREASLLSDTEYQQHMAEHIAKALAYHFSSNVAR